MKLEEADATFEKERDLGVTLRQHAFPIYRTLYFPSTTALTSTLSHGAIASVQNMCQTSSEPAEKVQLSQYSTDGT